MYAGTFIRIADALKVSLDVLADVGEMEKQQKIQREAFYIISHDKSPEEIQYAVEMVQMMFKLKENYLR